MANELTTREPRDTGSAYDTAKNQLMTELQTQKLPTVESSQTQAKSERETTLGLLDKRIEQIDERVAEETKRLREEEATQLGQAQGINVRSGVAGSPFASALTGKIRKGTRESITGIEREGDLEKEVKQQQVQQALLQIEERARLREKDIRQERLGLLTTQYNIESAEEQKKIEQERWEKSYSLQKEQLALQQQSFAFQQSQASFEQDMAIRQQANVERQQAVSDLSVLASSGTLTIGEVEATGLLDELAGQTGKSKEQLKLYFNSQLPQTQQVDYQMQVAGDKLIAFGVDPVSGKLSVLEEKLPIDIQQEVQQPNKELKEVDGELWVVDIDNDIATKVAGEKSKDTELRTVSGVGLVEIQSDGSYQVVVPEQIKPEDLTYKQKVDLEVKLSNNFESYAKESRGAMRNIDTIETGYREAVQAGFDSKSLNAPSQAVLVTFQKMLDPTSVVRQSEYARSGEGLSLKNRIKGTVEKLQYGGAGLTQKDLKDFYDISKKLLEGYQARMLNFAQRTQTQAENYGLNLENILTPDVIGLLEGQDVEQNEDNLSDDEAWELYQQTINQ